MRKPKLREIGEAIKSLFRRPYTSKFPQAAVKPPEGFRGRPRYHKEDCVGCQACVEVCPARAIDVEDILMSPGRGFRRLTHRYDVCIYCGQCEAACITGEGIKLSLEWELSGIERPSMTDVVEKDLLFCEICGSPIGCTDHLKWIAKKVGLIAYANPTIYLTRHKEDLKLLLQAAARDDREIGRNDQVRITCPSCRREVLFTEAW